MKHLHRDIVERCKRGEREAQFQLYKLYSRAMYNICLRMLHNEADAEDMLQNAFVDVFTKLDTFRFDSTIGAWIKRIVINNCINFLKKRKLKFEELNDYTARAPDIPEDEPQTWNTDKIRKAIFELPEGYRVVFSLYLLEGYDHEEISEVLGISVSTSKSQYSRAKKKLRELLADYQFTTH